MIIQDKIVVLDNPH